MTTDAPELINKFFAAARDGLLDNLKNRIAKGVDINATDINGWSALHFSSVNGHLSCVQWLVEHGAEIDVINRQNGGTPLHFAASGGHLYCLKHLHENGADIFAKNSNGETALHLAACQGKLDCVQYLVKQKLDIHESSSFSSLQTPFYLTITYDHIDCFKHLIESSPEKLKIPSIKAGAFRLAKQHGREDFIEFLNVFMASYLEQESLDKFIETKEESAAHVDF